MNLLGYRDGAIRQQSVSQDHPSRSIRSPRKRAFHLHGVSYCGTRNPPAPSFFFPAAALLGSQGRRLSFRSWRSLRDFPATAQMNPSGTSRESTRRRTAYGGWQAGGEFAPPALALTNMLPPPRGETRLPHGGAFCE